MNRANNTEEKLNERINGGWLRAHLSLVRALMVSYHLEETLGRKERGHFPANDHLHAPHKGSHNHPDATELYSSVEDSRVESTNML